MPGSGHGRAMPVLGAGAALGGFTALLVLLASVGHPLVSGATFLGLVLLARAAGATKLIVVSVIVGAGMLVVVPGVSLVDGSFELAYASGAWSPPAGVGGWLAAVGSSLRVPASVLAAVLLWIVPGRLLVAATARMSPRAGLLGGLAARMRPLLVRDLSLLRDELASRGVGVDRSASLARRMSGAVALWEASIAGMLDRSFQTAAALETRGYGRGRPTMDALSHPELVEPSVRDERVDAFVLTASMCVVVGAPLARSFALVQGPGGQALSNLADPLSPAVVLCAFLGMAIALAPCCARRRATGPQVRDAGAVMPAMRAPQGDAGPVLEVSSVTMRHPRATQPSLVGASLQLAAGELVVAAGVSGSGKSTLLDVVTGVAPRATGGVREGRVRLGAHVLGLDSGVGDSRVAAVFQVPESQVLVGLVAEEVAFGLRHAGCSVQSIEQRVLAVLDRLGIRHLAQRDCATLSGGELQRVLLAAALVLEPSVLVLDEPTSQVDAASERAFWSAVDDARRELGVAVLVAEHRLDVVLHRADRVLVFDGGRIVAEVPASQLRQVAPWMCADAYEGLAPAPVGRQPRLVVSLPRIEVGSGASSGRTLLRGVSLAVPAGGIVTLEGPNGVGKSTLLRAIRGLHPAAGFVSVDGVPRGSVSGSVRQFGMLSQGVGGVLVGRSVADAIGATCRLLGIDEGPAHAAVASAGLADRLDAHPSELSVGERQRLALVVATAHRPAVWLLDEPTRGMDACARSWVARLMLAHASAGGVVLLATHDSALAAAVATHRLRLDLRTGPTLVEVQRRGDGVLVVDAGARVVAEPEVQR